MKAQCVMSPSVRYLLFPNCIAWYYFSFTLTDTLIILPVR